jgi:hypothetical protein
MIVMQKKEEKKKEKKRWTDAENKFNHIYLP